MDVLIGVIITFLVVILVLYLVNMLPLDARARQIVRIIVIILGDFAAEVSCGVLGHRSPASSRPVFHARLIELCTNRGRPEGGVR
jgi:hypothetical protein